MYGASREGTTGPVENKLLQYGDLQGLVVGAFGEGSEDLHSLVQLLAESKVNAMGLARGRGGTEAELGMLVGQIRRMLSITNVRAQAQCLLARMNSIGGGGGFSSQKKEMGCHGGGEDEEGEADSVGQQGKGEEHCQEGRVPPQLVK